MFKKLIITFICTCIGTINAAQQTTLQQKLKTLQSAAKSHRTISEKSLPEQKNWGKAARVFCCSSSDGIEIAKEYSPKDSTITTSQGVYPVITIITYTKNKKPADVHVETSSGYYSYTPPPPAIMRRCSQS